MKLKSILKSLLLVLGLFMVFSCDGIATSLKEHDIKQKDNLQKSKMFKQISSNKNSNFEKGLNFEKIPENAKKIVFDKNLKCTSAQNTEIRSGAVVTVGHELKFTVIPPKDWSVTPVKWGYVSYDEIKEFENSENKKEFSYKVKATDPTILEISAFLKTDKPKEKYLACDTNKEAKGIFFGDKGFPSIFLEDSTKRGDLFYKYIKDYQDIAILFSGMLRNESVNIEDNLKAKFFKGDDLVLLYYGQRKVENSLHSPGYDLKILTKVLTGNAAETELFKFEKSETGFTMSKKDYNVDMGKNGNNTGRTIYLLQGNNIYKIVIQVPSKAEIDKYNKPIALNKEIQELLTEQPLQNSHNAAQIIKQVAHLKDKKNKTEEEKFKIIKAVHDYLIKTVTYNSTDADAYTAYGAIVNKKAACNGYALGFNEILKHFQFNEDDYKYVPGPVRLWRYKYELHAWNIVKLNGKWYHIDTTWDDFNGGRYKYFLKSHAYMIKNDHRNQSNQISSAIDNLQYGTEYDSDEAESKFKMFNLTEGFQAKN